MDDKGLRPSEGSCIISDKMNKKFYLTVDTETATIPFANQICKNANQKQKIAIAKPTLAADKAWCDVQLRVAKAA